MKKTALLFIALLVILASIDFIWPFTTERTDGYVFEQGLNTAEMQTYQDPDLGFTVRYPSFFAVRWCQSCMYVELDDTRDDA